MNFFLKTFLFFFLSLIFSTAYAESSSTALIFDVLPSDLSLSFIYYLFGPITEVAPGLMIPNSVTTVMKNFISIAASLTFVIIGFVSIQAAFTGAAHGDFLGEKISFLDSGMKIGGGMMLLIPNHHGYSAIQYFFMWMILNGIGLANHLWAAVINNYSMGNTLTTQHMPDAASKVEDVSKSLMNAALAIAFLQKENPDSQILAIPYAKNGSNTSVYICDQNIVGNQPCNAKNSIIEYPVKDLGDKTPTTTEILTTESLSILLYGVVDEMIKDGLISYALTYDLSVAAPSVHDLTTFFGQDYCTFTIGMYEQKIQSLLEPFAKKSSETEKILEDMISSGWMSAAYYYWDLNSGSGSKPAAEEILAEMAANASTVVSASIFGGKSLDPNIYSNLYASAQPNIAAYISNLYTVKNTSPSHSSSYNNIITSVQSAGLDKMFALSGSNFLLKAFITDDMDFYKLDYNFTIDRFSAFMQSNYKVVVAILECIVTMILFMFVFAISAGVLRGQFPFFYMFMFCCISLFVLLIPFLSSIMTTALMGCVYVSAVPGLIFGAAAFAWMLKVIEAIISAPLIAMLMVIPQEDSERNIEHVFMQLLVVTLRPSLMILGFVAASKIVQLAIMFVGGAFNQIGQQLMPIVANGGGGIVFLMLVYELTAMTTIAVITRSFNIINLLPETIFSSIGVHSNDQEADALISQFEQAGQKGADAMSNTLNIMNGISKSLLGLAKKLHQGDK